MDPSAASAIRRAIEEHLSAHPQAADSADGVARWWVEARGVHASVHDVRCVLSELVASKALRRVVLADGVVLYAKGP